MPAPTDLVSRALRSVRARPRLLASIVVGVLVGLALPDGPDDRERVLLGWDAGALSYLVAAFTMMARAQPGEVRSRAVDEDDGAATALLLTVVAALFSVASIVIQVWGDAAISPTGLGLMCATVVVSWALVHTVFALHYAHEFELGCAAAPDEDPATAGGLAFPGSEPPDYLDFVYFAFVVGVAAQTADVAITRRALRRLVTVHGVVAFWFNATILALALNLLGRG